MSRRLTYQPLTQQPQGAAALEYDNPLFRELSALWNGATPLIELLSGQQRIGGDNPSFATYEVSPAGLGQTTSVVSPFISINFALATPMPAQSEFTLFCRSVITTLPASESIFLELTNVGGEFVLLNILSTGALQGTTVRANTTVNSDATYSVGQIVDVAYRCRDGEQTLWINGVRQSAVGTQSTSVFQNRTEFRIRSSCAVTVFSGCVNRAYSDAEIGVLQATPWQLFAPGRIRVPVTAGGGGGNTIAVPAGALALTGLAPTVIATANQRIDVPAGSLSLTAFAPTVTSSVRVQVPAGALTLTGYAPTVVATANNRIAVPAGALTLTGYAPTVAAGATQTISVPAGALTLTAYAPTVTATQNNVISVPAGALSLTAYAPNVTGAARVIEVPAGSLALTGYAPTVTNGAEVFSSSAVFYIPLRMVSGLWSTTGVSASVPTDKQAWLPPIRQPIAYTDTRDGRQYCDPAWYRAFEFIFETRLGGRLGPSIPDVVSTVAATQETAAAASATIAEVAQQTQANAEALFVVREVVQAGALPGSGQIPTVEL